MKEIGLVVNLEKEPALELAGEVIKWCNQRGVVIRVHRQVMAKLPTVQARPWSDEGNPEFIITLGGDGTLLDAARRVAHRGIPLVGVNLGKLGFLTEVEPPEVFSALEEILEGRFWIDERMMLSATVLREGRPVGSLCALNDVVVTKAGFSRMIELKTMVGEQYVSTYSADGLIVASPTGSTAYSLSAGGPLVTPDLQLMILTPICPHSLTARPLVISANERVVVCVHAPRSEVVLTVDGQHGFELRHRDTIEVCRAPFSARLLRRSKYNFFATTRAKLEGGARSE